MLNSISVKNKIWLILSVALISSGSILLSALINNKNQLIESREKELTHLVENVETLIKSFYLQSPEIGEEKAKVAALSAVEKLRYDNGTGYFWINDFSAKIVLHPLKMNLNGKDLSNFKDPEGNRIFYLFAQAAQNPAGEYVSYFWEKPGSSKPVPKISFIKGFKPWGWAIGTGVYIDDINDIFWNNVYNATFFFSLIIMVLVLIGFAIANNIIVPLQKIVKGMEKVADGHLNVQFSSDNRKDELGQLSESANRMLISFKGLINNITSSSNQLIDASQQLAKSSQQTSSDMQHQLKQSELVATSIEEVGATVQDVTKNIIEAAKATEKVDTETKSSNTMMVKTIEKICAMSEGLSSTSDAIIKLEEDTRQIEGVLNVIRGISDQTNLLALNAAIEAARAGESGRGFAVVADEVRTLAQRTQTSTELLQNAAHNAVSAMSDGQLQVESAINLATDTGKSMEQIEAQVSILNNMNTTIATAAEQQSTVIQEVSQNIININNTTEETSNMTTINARNSDELQKTAQKIDIQLSKFQL